MDKAVDQIGPRPIFLPAMNQHDVIARQPVRFAGNVLEELSRRLGPADSLGNQLSRRRVDKRDRRLVIRRMRLPKAAWVWQQTRCELHEPWSLGRPSGLGYSNERDSASLIPEVNKTYGKHGVRVAAF